MNKLQTIVADTINSAIQTKTCPICNGNLYYNKVFTYQNNLLFTDTRYICDHLMFSKIEYQKIIVFNVYFPNTLVLVPPSPHHPNITFAQMNGKELKLDNLEADNFKALYNKLNKIVTFQ